jgi:hypothetical protein
MSHPGTRFLLMQSAFVMLSNVLASSALDAAWAAGEYANAQVSTGVDYCGDVHPDVLAALCATTAAIALLGALAVRKRTVAGISTCSVILPFARLIAEQPRDSIYLLGLYGIAACLAIIVGLLGYGIRMWLTADHERP